MNKKIIKLLLCVAGSSILIACAPPNKNSVDSKINQEISNDIEISSREDFVSKDEKKIPYDEKYLKLVNRTQTLDSSYEPKDLVEVNIPFSGSSDSKRMESVAARAIEDMFKSAREDGIKLIGRSGYRSYNTQASNYKNKVAKLGKVQADRFVAPPGASEHQTGLAMDIISSEFSKLHTDFQYTKSYNWLRENCAKFGFIQSYMKGKSDITGFNFEPWHFRYVGIEHAKTIMDNNLSLEEYLNQYVDI